MPEPLFLVIRSVARLPVRAIDASLWLYQRLVSPALHALAPGCGCRFAPTCSHYAREALREHGFFTGLVLALRRLAKCGPWHPGGLDPVPVRKLSCTRVAPQTSVDRVLLTRSLS